MPCQDKERLYRDNKIVHFFPCLLKETVTLVSALVEDAI